MVVDHAGDFKNPTHFSSGSVNCKGLYRKGKDINKIFSSKQKVKNFINNSRRNMIRFNKSCSGKTYEEILGEEKAKKRLNKISGKNSCFYKNSKKNQYGFGFGNKLKKIIFQRDNGLCQVCFKKIEKKRYYFCCHHINYNKKDNRLINIVLVHSNYPFKCHQVIHTNIDYWFSYFCRLKVIEPEVLL